MQNVWNRGAWRRPLAVLAILMFTLPLTGLAASRQQADSVQVEISRMQAESKARAAIVKEASPAVVNITVVKHADSKETAENQEIPAPFNDPFFRKFFGDRLPRPPRNFELKGLGSGIIVSSKGYVLTNNHVVSGADKITVKLPDGREFDAKVVGTDPPSDVAVVRIEGKDLPVAKLGNSDDLEVGESVLAIGNPFGLEQTTTAGIVSAKGRNQIGIADYENFIQTDASINPGNSGGPLLNLHGEVVGMNTAIYGNSGGNMGIGFAIPINQAHEVMDQLVANGKVVRGFLGVVIQDMTPDLAGAMNVKPHEGVLVASVGDDTPAKRAGIRQGDVILAFQGRDVSSVGALRNAVAAVKPGSSVPAEVLRDGKKVALTVNITEQPKDMKTAMNDSEKHGDAQGSSDEVLGMSLQPLTPELAAQMEVKPNAGVAVTDVDDGSPAAEAGIQQGMVIEQVNHQAVHSPEDVRKQVAERPAKGRVLMLVRAGGGSHFVAIEKP